MADKTKKIKRKHKTLSLAAKYDILQKLDSGESSAQLAREYNVGNATIYDIKKNRNKIEKFVKNAGLDASTRRTLKLCEFRLMEEVLFSWFLEERRHNKNLTDKTIQNKSLHFYKEIYKNTNFKASEGWFHNFKARYGIKGLYDSIMKTNLSKLNEKTEVFEPNNGNDSVSLSTSIIQSDKSVKNWDIRIVTKTEPLKETEDTRTLSGDLLWHVPTEIETVQDDTISQAKMEDSSESEDSNMEEDSSTFVTHLRTRLDKLEYQQKFIAQKLISDVMMLAETNQLHLTSAVVNRALKRRRSNTVKGSDPLQVD